MLRAVRLGSRWTATWLAVLLLAAAEAFVPLLWLATAILAIAVLAVGVARRGIKSLWRGRSATARLLAMVVVPPLLLLPWSWDVATHPTRLWLEAGAPAPGTIDTQLPSWALALAQPGGPVAGARWLLLGTVIAALASLVRRDRRRPVVLGWAVALVGLGACPARARPPDPRRLRVGHLRRRVAGRGHVCWSAAASSPRPSWVATDYAADCPRRRSGGDSR